MKEISYDKKALRREILARRDKMDPKERREKSSQICRQLCSLPQFTDADILLAFASYGSEVETDGIIEEALTAQKKVYLPRVEGEELQFYRILLMEDLKTGYKGIREPEPAKERALELTKEALQQTLLLVPGVVFDKSGGRIGYGKGFYDRFLQRLEQADVLSYIKLLAIGFSLQLTENDTIPMEHTDRRIPQLLTEDGLVAID